MGPLHRYMLPCFFVSLQVISFVHSQQPYFLLSNVLAKKCLKATNQQIKSTYNLAPCNSTDIFQHWRQNGAWDTDPGKPSYVRNVGSDLCVCGALQNANNKNGAMFYQCKCDDKKNTKFTAAANGKFDPSGKSTFWIQGTNTGRVFSVRKDGMILVHWDKNDTMDPQNLWTVWTPRVVLLKNDGTETCIRVSGDYDNANFVVANCNPADLYQQFEHSGVWMTNGTALSYLKSMGSQECMSGNGGDIGTVEGFLAYQYGCNPAVFHSETFNLANGTYDESGVQKFWIQVRGKKCLTPKTGAVDLVQGTCKDSPEFYWRVYAAPPRAIALKNLEFQLCMTVKGTNLVLSECLPPAVELPKFFIQSSIWERDPTASANLSLYMPMAKNGMCLSSADSNTVNNKDGYNIYMANCSGNANYQLYNIGKGKFSANGRTIFQIKSVPSDKCLAVQSNTGFVAQYACADMTNFFWTATPLPFSQRLQDRPDCVGPKSKKERCGPVMTAASDNAKYICAATNPECCYDDTVDYKDDSDPSCFRLVM